jgi:hypothetical protein
MRVKSRKVLKRFRKLLDEAGVDPKQPSTDDVGRTWDVIRVFAAEPVEDAEPPEREGDGLLAQYGTYDWGGGEHFELDITRQLSFADRHGEYAGMKQLHCSFWFEPTDELRALGAGDVWSFGMPLDEFFEHALALPGFRAVADNRLQPQRLVVDYTDV